MPDANPEFLIHQLIQVEAEGVLFAPEEIIHAIDLTSAATFGAVAATISLNPNKVCFAKQSTLAEWTGTSRRTAQTSLNKLVQHQYLHFDPTPGTTNHYRINQEKFGERFKLRYNIKKQRWELEGNFIPIYETVLREYGLTAAGVYGYLVRVTVDRAHAKYGDPYPSARKVATHLGLSIRTAKRALILLSRGNMVEIADPAAPASCRPTTWVRKMNGPEGDDYSYYVYPKE
jgi:hypothetical protein